MEELRKASTDHQRASIEVNKGIRSTYGTSVEPIWITKLASPSDPEVSAVLRTATTCIHVRSRRFHRPTVSHQPPTPTKAQIASESPSGLGTSSPVISGVSPFHLATRRKQPCHSRKIRRTSAMLSFFLF
jgi:hypothetical protein